MNSVLIVIPARYGSSRLPGKPLHKIAGIAMLKRVAMIAQHVCNTIAHCDYVVATDDARIQGFCAAEGIAVTLTSSHCKSGTERCFEVVQKLRAQQRCPALIVNLQGDNPLCPPWFIETLIATWRQSAAQQQADTEQANSDQARNEQSAAQVYTPFVHLTWEQLDELRASKRTTPFSGTTVQVDNNNYALTFSKLILPAMRKEAALRQRLPKPPVRRHIGLYAYTYAALERYLQLPASDYEIPEGLEQMRFVEHAIPIKMVQVDYRGRHSMSGVDSPADIQRAEAVLAASGEFELHTDARQGAIKTDIQGAHQGTSPASASDGQQ